jgi:hypothetical protein
MNSRETAGRRRDTVEVSDLNRFLNHMGISFAKWSAIPWMAIATGAQTERRGGAGPVGGLLGSKDPTGRLVGSGFFSLSLPFQSQIVKFPNTSSSLVDA